MQGLLKFKVDTLLRYVFVKLYLDVICAHMVDFCMPYNIYVTGFMKTDHNVTRTEIQIMP